MCTFETNKIYLTWKKEKECTRHIIGILQQIDNNYVFSYIEKNIDAAKQDGFTNYPAFDDLNTSYAENVLEIFNRRLINPTRSDYDKFLSYWSANSYKGNVFALLGLTGAKLLTDNFEFIAPHEEIPAEFYTNISWMSKSNNEIMEEVRIADLTDINNNLSIEPDKENLFYNKAIAVKYKNEQLGYIKSIHCDNIYNAIKNNKKIIVSVKNIIKNGIIKDILLKIVIK